MIRRAAAPAIALVLAVGACSAGPSSPAGPAAAPVSTAVVDLPPSYRFAPVDVTVAAGTTVTWTNHDHFTHSVQLVGGDASSEPLVMEPGSSTTFTFERAGAFPYICHLHPQNMKGSVTVTP